MCSILSWSGRLPQGLLTNLIRKSEIRGKDSTGVGFRALDKGVTKTWQYRAAERPSDFLKSDMAKQYLGTARRSLIGIAHTRHASPGMPVDEENAHPFAYWRLLFAHNGRVENWKDLKTQLSEHFAVEAARLKLEGQESASIKAIGCKKYMDETETDSKVLGPYINARNFDMVEGCMALVWIQSENVYTFRYGKEAIAAEIVWSQIDKKPETKLDEDLGESRVTVVASTADILVSALDTIKDTVTVSSIRFQAFEEKHVYRIEPTGLVDEGEVPVNVQAHEDQFSSEVVV